MTLYEFLGVLVGLIGAIIAVVVSLVFGLGWWSVLIGIAGLFAGWFPGVLIAAALIRSDVLTPPQYKKRSKTKHSTAPLPPAPPAPPEGGS